MASLNSTITIEPERRPCMVSRRSRSGEILERQRALFHQLVTVREIVPPSPVRGGHQGGQVQDVFAVVEFDDGTLNKVDPERVQFLDSAAVFGEYVWPDEEGAKCSEN